MCFPPHCVCSFLPRHTFTTSNFVLIGPPSLFFLSLCVKVLIIQLSPPHLPPTPLPMIFGNETPFHLKPIPNRGVRKLEAERAQHYAGYEHPLAPSADSAAYQSDAHRLQPHLTPADELQHDRAVEHDLTQRRIQIRRERQLQREAALAQQREKELLRVQRRASQLAGTDIRNAGSEGRDVITHECHTVEARRRKEYEDARGQHQYFARQRALDQRVNPSGYNIITWEPRPAVQVPPRPAPLE